jgi:FkbM family methyltransferase
MFFSKLIILILNFFDYFQQKKIIKLINKKFSKPITIFDVGAHYGETINLFCKNFDIKEMYSFEASSKNFKILGKNVSKHLSKNIKIFNYGLGDKVESNFINQLIESSSSTINEINMNSNYFQKKIKILNLKNKKNFLQKIPIKIITMDHFIEKNNIDKIDLLKIDTEGYELNVLKGLNKFYKNVSLIYFEHHYDDMIKKNYKFNDIHELLKFKGFKMISKSKMFFRKSFEYVYENQKK